MISEYLRSGGITHVHTDLSKDGRYTLNQVGIYISRNLRSQYVAVADHLTSPYNETIYSADEAGLRVGRMFSQVEQYNASQQSGPVCVTGVEVNIKPNGLDIPNEVLKKIDFVIASRHYPWGNEAVVDFEHDMENTMKCPYVDVIGHIDRYSPSGVDWKRLLKVAKETHTIVEVNFDSPPRQEILELISALHLPVTFGIDFHTFNGWLRTEKSVGGIEASYSSELGYRKVRQAVAVACKVAEFGINPDKIINIREYPSFIGLLRTDKNDRTF